MLSLYDSENLYSMHIFCVYAEILWVYAESLCVSFQLCTKTYQKV